MSGDHGASSCDDRAFAASPSSPAVSPVPASIPSAREMVMQWSTDQGYVRLTFPSDLSMRDVEDVSELLAITVTGMQRRAQAIKAQGAAS